MQRRLQQCTTNTPAAICGLFPRCHRHRPIHFTTLPLSDALSFAEAELEEKERW